MDEKDVEREIRFHMVQIGKLLSEYGSDEYLSMYLKPKEGYLTFNNAYWEDGTILTLNHTENEVDFSPRKRYDGEVLAKFLRRVLFDGCNELCDGCELYVDENYHECTNFLIKAILEADWSKFTMTDAGMIENRYVEKEG